MTPEHCKAAVDSAFPELASGEPVELNHGWSFHTFRLGDVVWRFPRSDQDATLLERESRLLPAVASRVPVAISVPEWVGTWEGKAFAGYRFISGEPITTAELRLPALRRDLGQFLTALHGVPLRDVAPHVAAAAAAIGWRQRHRDLLTAIELRTDGLLAPAMIRTIRRRMTVAIDRLEFTPVLAHADLGYNEKLGILDHILAVEGTLSGVLDFSDMRIDDAAIDFAGFLAAGGWDAVDGVSDAYQGALGERFRERVAFHYWVGPLHDIIYGLDVHDDHLVGETVVELDRRLDATGTVV